MLRRLLRFWRNGKRRPEGTEPGQLNPTRERSASQGATAHQAGSGSRVRPIVLVSLRSAAGEFTRCSRRRSSRRRPPSRSSTVLVGPGSLTDIAVTETPGLLTRAEGNTYRELERKVQSFQVDSPGSPPRAMVVREDDTPHNPHVFIRGNHARPGKEVPRQFLLAVAGFDRQPFEHGSGRLELARAIVSPDNPLTARVIVNRVWMHHFGAPLVSTPSDFGTRSDRPVQADTLDYLASQLIAQRLVAEEPSSRRSSYPTPISRRACVAPNARRLIRRTCSTGG